MSILRIACVQMDVEIENVQSNRSRIIQRIREAAESDARLAVFPECALTGYCYESLDEARPFAETLRDQSSQDIAAACRETGVYAVVGFIEKDGGNLFNSAMLVGPSGPIGSYRKVHLPFLGVDRFLTPGDKPFQVFELPIGRIGILICYDASFPEAARVLKLLGAELIVLPTNWPPGAARNPEFVLNTRAQENHVNFAAVNRVGVERGWRFIGRSKVVDFNGDTCAEAGDEKEEILQVDLDLGQANNNLIVNQPGRYEIDRIADRRPEFYEILTRGLPAKSRSTS